MLTAKSARPIGFRNRFQQLTIPSRPHNRSRGHHLLSVHSSFLDTYGTRSMVSAWETAPYVLATARGNYLCNMKARSRKPIRVRDIVACYRRAPWLAIKCRTQPETTLEK